MIDLCLTYWKYARRRFGVVCLPVAVKLSEIGVPVLFGLLISELSRRETGDWTGGVGYFIAIAVLHALNLLLDYMLELLKARERVDYAVQLKKLAMSRLLFMTSQKREERTVAEWGQRISGDTQMVADSASSAVLQLGSAMWMLVLTAAIVSVLAPAFLVLMLLLAGVFYLIWRRNRYSLMETATTQRETAYRESSLTYDMVSAASLLPIYRAVSRLLQRYDVAVEQTGAADVGYARNSTAYSTQIKCALLLANVLGLATGVALYVCGMLDIGSVVTFSMLMGLVAGHMGQLVFVIPVLNRGLESYQSLRQVFGSFDWSAGSSCTEEPATAGEHPSLAVQTHHLEFSYANRPWPIFDKLDWQVEHRSYVSILGGNGVGKSTLIKLLLGILEPEKGCVNRFFFTPGYVAQHTVILNASLWDNVTLCDSSADPDKVRQVIQIAMLEPLATRLGGLHAPVCRERLSGGEVQRIGVARALMQAPDILILDEVTNNLDIVCKGEVFQVLRKLKGKCTIISVSHDMEALADSDACYLLRNGSLSLIEGDSAQQRRESALNLMQDSYR